MTYSVPWKQSAQVIIQCAYKYYLRFIYWDMVIQHREILPFLWLIPLCNYIMYRVCFVIFLRTVKT